MNQRKLIMNNCIAYEELVTETEKHLIIKGEKKDALNALSSLMLSDKLNGGITLLNE